MTLIKAERRAAAQRMDELTAAAGQVKREREAVIMRLQMSAQQMQKTIVEQTRTEAPEFKLGTAITRCSF